LSDIILDINRNVKEIIMGRAKLTNEQFDTNRNLKSRKIKRLSDYSGPYDKINFLCTKCQFTWKSQADTIRKKGCPNCAGNRKLTNRIVDEKIKKTNIIRLSNIINSRSPIKVICKKCEYSWETNTNSLINHKTGCPKCSGRIPISIQNVNEKLEKEERNIKALQKPKHSKQQIKWKCLECNHIWIATVNGVMHAKSNCPRCAKNPRYNEKRTHKYLERLFPNSSIKKQKLINKEIKMGDETIRSKIFIDFEVKDGDNIIYVEYNGRQHYEPCDRFGGESEFRKVQIRDEWLRAYCKDKNVHLIEIDGRKYYGGFILKCLELAISKIKG